MREPNTMKQDTLLELATRLEKRAKDERDYAANNTLVAELLQPEFAKWEARKEPFNLYAVRMAVEHRNSAKKDAAFADDLEQAIAIIRAQRPHNDRQTQ